MDYTSKILKRSNIGGIVDYLLYGDYTAKEGDMGYKERLEKAYKKCEETLVKYDSKKDSILSQEVKQLLYQSEKVYMEIGFQTGLLLMNDAIKLNSFILEEDEHKINKFQNMYDFLFHGITEAIDILDNNGNKQIIQAIELLKHAQCKAEELYMNENHDQNTIGN